MLILCLMATGCLRVGFEALGRSLSPGAYHSEASKHYYYGTMIAAACIPSPLLPIAILDLPFEFVIDTFLFPFQLARDLGIDPSFRSEVLNAWIDGKQLEELVRDDNWQKFHLQVTDPNYYYFYERDKMGRIFDQLEGHSSHAFRYIDFLYKKDARYAEDLLCDDRCLHACYYPLYRKMLGKWLKPTEVPSEHAVFSAVITNRDAEPKLLELVALLLDNGCNPNAPETTPQNGYNHIHRTPFNIINKTALDEAEYLADFYKRPEYISSGKYRTYEKLVTLLRSHGAKNWHELHDTDTQKGRQASTRLANYYVFRDRQRFIDKLKHASQEELDEAMKRILLELSYPLEDRWFPKVFQRRNVKNAESMSYMELLVNKGAKFPADLLCMNVFMRLPPKAEERNERQLEIYKAFRQRQADVMPCAGLYYYAFSHGLSPKDHPREFAILCFCSRVVNDAQTYHKAIPDFLRLLIQSGCNPNAVKSYFECTFSDNPNQRGITDNSTALDIIMNDINDRHAWAVRDHDGYIRLLTELQDILTKAGAKRFSELSNGNAD